MHATGSFRQLCASLLAITLFPSYLIVGCSRVPDRVPFTARTLEVAPVAYDLEIEVDFDEPKKK